MPGSPCPACGQPLTYAAVALSPSLRYIRCASCRQWLQPDWTHAACTAALFVCAMTSAAVGLILGWSFLLTIAVTAGVAVVVAHLYAPILMNVTRYRVKEPRREER